MLPHSVKIRKQSLGKQRGAIRGDEAVWMRLKRGLKGEKAMQPS
jgi:hypothetical protein